MKFPTDFSSFMSQENFDLFQFSFHEIEADERVFVFNNFLGDTNDLNTDLILWHEFTGICDDYLAFGNGVFGDSFLIKVSEKDNGKIYVSFDEDGAKVRLLIANSFEEFLNKLTPMD